VNAVLSKHEVVEDLDYSNDSKYRGMVSESLQAVTMATSAVQVFVFGIAFPQALDAHALRSFGKQITRSASRKYKAAACLLPTASCSGC